MLFRDSAPFVGTSENCPANLCTATHAQVSTVRLPNLMIVMFLPYPRLQIIEEPNDRVGIWTFEFPHRTPISFGGEIS